jgi:hypothetical protein
MLDPFDRAIRNQAQHCDGVRLEKLEKQARDSAIERISVAMCSRCGYAVEK